MNMTEAEWLICEGACEILSRLGTLVSDRKIRLAVCACSRRLWHLLEDERSRHSIETSERFAEGIGDPAELHMSHAQAAEALLLALADSRWAPMQATQAARWCSASTRTGLIQAVAAAERASEAARSDARVIDNEAEYQCVLIRHIIGNPFRPYPALNSWPSDVIHLAEAMYAGQDCHHYGLCDALLDAGHEELAEHFREPGHPKGCWVLDLILGKS
jgi:hypothetical protein